MFTTGQYTCILYMSQNWHINVYNIHASYPALESFHYLVFLFVTRKCPPYKMNMNSYNPIYQKFIIINWKKKTYKERQSETNLHLSSTNVHLSIWIHNIFKTTQYSTDQTSSDRSYYQMPHTNSSGNYPQ